MHRFKKIVTSYSVFQSIIFGLLGGLIAFIFLVPASYSGTLPEWLGAIGTVSAVILSLYLSLGKKEIGVQIYQDNINMEGSSQRTHGHVINEYDFGTNIFVINPDDKNYIVSLESATVIVAGIPLDNFNIQFFSKKVPSFLSII